MRSFLNLGREELEHLRRYSWQELKRLSERDTQKDDERRFIEELMQALATDPPELRIESVSPPPMSTELIRIIGFTTLTFESDRLHYPHTARWYEESARRLRSERVGQNRSIATQTEAKAQALDEAAVELLEKQVGTAQENRDFWIRRGATNLTVANGALGLAVASAMLNGKLDLLFGQIMLGLAVAGMIAAGIHPLFEYWIGAKLHKEAAKERDRLRMPVDVRRRPGEWELKSHADKARLVALIVSAALFLGSIAGIFGFGAQNIRGYAKPASQAPSTQSTPPAQELPAVKPE